ncbi:glycoside hydrolase family 3 N-terminal domain-containing protein [Alteromonas sp. ASW11-36]|uniref:beta-glucosidase n=1 Tax=Alteromonas arenosi TaxID=3055817 RepID=A0ABT7SVZ4_9ALTE|nr:glycoside hydrolase family 3 N-terminal domain-containing protein [Alteromonas sp. ASW11-36]MDM7860341.1 glycoside hydrolase family 3 N-terminal domain-containing protein [Alteromonas sp. ASW11-36]
MTTTSPLNEPELQRAKDLLDQMSVTQKLGQMHQVNGAGGVVTEQLAHDVRMGNVGSVINEVDAEVIAQLQSIAVNESPHGIPLLIGRDVIHGFKTVFPLPIGLASTWCDETIERSARLSAIEASAVGINWTFSPMIDVSRDPRWGRIAESFGEDPLLNARMGAAMVRGYQTEDPSQTTAIAACAKHFAAYGASESGRDYNTTNVSEHELRHVYLPPFKAACEAGVLSVMTSFSDLNGVPVSGNEWLLTDVLRHEWRFNGVVVSDWGSVQQLTVHGVAENDKAAAEQAINAGVEIEMVSGTFINHAEALLHSGVITIEKLDAAVLNILAMKIRLGLFEQHYLQGATSPYNSEEHTKEAYEAAVKSCVLLKNNGTSLPIACDQRIALLGPLADDGYEQLGTWVFDGDVSISQTVLDGFRQRRVEVNYLPVFASTRDHDNSRIPLACDAAAAADAVVLCLGEEAILSGEAHCRAELDLPGAQEELIRAVSRTLRGRNVPIILVVLAGRPLALECIEPFVDAILYAWHPGSMAGPAIADLVLGERTPSGKLPVSFVRKVGQIPLYYGQKPTGRPVTHDNYVHMDQFPMRAEQTSLGMAASHIDTHFTPMYPFGYGLSYTQFEYRNLQLSSHEVSATERLDVTVEVVNCGKIDADEVVQLYIRDKVSSVSRPVRELKGYQRISIPAGQSRLVSFSLSRADLGFYNQRSQYVVETGTFTLWIGGDSTCDLSAEFNWISQ